MSKSFNKLILSTLYFSMLAMAFTTKAQTSQWVDEPVQLLNEHNSRYPLEKVFLHTDRKHYAAGEPIWYQAYVVAGFYHEPSPLSNNLYVTLHREDKSVLDQQMIRIDVGAGHGVIDLPDSLASGSYVLRAYTNWMKNFDEAYFFEKELIIVGEDNNQASVARTEDIDLQFFPEGGQLVDMVASRVAFKATDEQGRSVAVSGIIYDQDDNEVTRFEAQHQGMGMLIVTPKKGKRYRAEVNGRTYSLPKVETEGFGIAANKTIADILRLTIRSNEATPNKEQLGILIHARGAVSFAFDIDLSKNIAFLNLPKAELPTGINHITLFDSQGNAILERLVFNDFTKATLSLTTDQPAYDKREKVTATIKVTDEEGMPVSGFFSMAAIDLGQAVDQAPQATILSNLLLSSDLKGHIADPMYYFDNTNPEAAKHLDLVMMTHGWTRFTWDSLPNTLSSTAQFPVEQGLNVTGKLMRLSSDKPSEEGEISLVNQNSTPPLFRNIKVDENGQFVFEDVLIFDDEEVVFQGVNKKGKPIVDISIKDSVFSATIDQFGIALQKSTVNPNEADLFREQKAYRDKLDETYAFDSTVTILETVVVEAEKKEERPIDPDLQRVNVYGKSDDTYKIKESEAIVSGNALEMISGKLGGVNVGGFGLNTTVTIRTPNAADVPQLPPLFLIDNVPTEIDGVLQLPAQIVERVEVYKGPSTSIFGVRGAAGVLAFFTKKSNLWTKTLRSRGVLTTVLKNSYRQPKAFYAPKYAVEKPEHVKPDNRIVLLWKPLILVDENGVAEIEFWNSDEASEVLLDLQGITMSGTPLSTTIRYQSTQ